MIRKRDSIEKNILIDTAKSNRLFTSHTYTCYDEIFRSNRLIYKSKKFEEEYNRFKTHESYQKWVHDESMQANQYVDVKYPSMVIEKYIWWISWSLKMRQNNLKMIIRKRFFCIGSYQRYIFHIYFEFSDHLANAFIFYSQLGSIIVLTQVGSSVFE